MMRSVRSHEPDGSLNGAKGEEAVRRIDFDDWGVGFSTPRLIRPQQPPLIASPDEPCRCRNQFSSPF
jgi:hypothetical protein